MSLSISSFGYIFFISLSLLFVGRYWRDYTTGILGGFLLFMLGVYVMINRLTGLTGWFSDVVGGVMFGLGAYVFIVGSLELLKDKGVV